MSIIAVAMRPFWASGLNEVAGRVEKGLGGWICDGDFQVYGPVLTNGFTLHFADATPLVRSLAADVSKIGLAPFETLNSISRSRRFPRSTAWLIIQTYYAAFYAGHALLRMLGKSWAPLGHEEIRTIRRVADLYGYPVEKPLQGGLYVLNVDAANSGVNASTARALGSRPHEAFWGAFCNEVRTLGKDVLSLGGGAIADRQLVSAKLGELEFNLTFGSCASGHWLSSVRNAVNYDLRLSAWYPYSGRRSYYDDLFRRLDEWRSDPVTLDLNSHGKQDLRRFQATCNFIVSMCRVSMEEMALRCPTGKSFLVYGPLAFMNLWR